MLFTIWQKNPDRGVMTGPLARGAEGLELSLVHWTPEHECRVVNLSVDKDGSVTVEHSTTESSDTGLDLEHITRLTLPGWEEEYDEP